MVAQNPETDNPPNAGLAEKADFDKRQKDEFKGKRTKGLRLDQCAGGGQVWQPCGCLMLRCSSSRAGGKLCRLLWKLLPSGSGLPAEVCRNQLAPS